MQAQYKIIGGDGREYGPATLEEIKGWIRDGRVAAVTQMWRNDLATWSPAGTYPELAEDFQTQPPPLPARVQAQEIPVGFWARLAAYIVDSLAISLVLRIVWPIVSHFTGWKVPELQLPAGISPDVDYATLMRLFSDYVKQMQAALPVMIASSITGRCCSSSMTCRSTAGLGRLRAR